MHVLVRNQSFKKEAYKSRVGLFEVAGEIEARMAQVDADHQRFNRERKEIAAPVLISNTFFERASEELSRWDKFFADEHEIGFLSDKEGIIAKTDQFKKELSLLTDEWLQARAKSPNPPLVDVTPVTPDKFSSNPAFGGGTGLAQRNKENRTIILVGIIAAGVVVTAITVTRAVRG